MTAADLPPTGAGSDNPASRKRLYIPDAYVDEICPPGRVSPDAWIASPAADVWCIAAADEDEDPGPVLSAGLVVAFCWVEDLGGAVIEIRPDGTHSVTGDVPVDVTHVWLPCDPDTLARSVDDFVTQWRALTTGADQTEHLMVRLSRWSPDDELFRFELAAGEPRFVRVEDGGRL